MSDGHGNEGEGRGQHRRAPAPNRDTATRTYVRGKEALKEIVTPLFTYIRSTGVLFILQRKELKRTEMRQTV